MFMNEKGRYGGMTPDILDFNNTILMITILLTSVGVLFICVYVYVNTQSSRSRNWFMAWMYVLLSWNWTYMMRRVAPSVTIAWFFYLVEVVSVIFLGPVLLSFARSYRGWENRRSVIVWLTFVTASLGSAYVVSNDWHHGFVRSFQLSYIQYGRSYYYLGVFEFICFMLSVYYFMTGVKKPRVYWRNQLYNVGGAVFVMGSSALLQVFGVFRTTLNLPLVLMPFTLIFIGIAILKYQFLDILPYTLKEAVQFIDDGYMVFDVEGNLETYNQLFFNRIGDLDRCRDIEDVVLMMGAEVPNSMALENLKYSLNVDLGAFISGELVFELEEGNEYIQYTTKAIRDNAGIKVASIVTFHNLTELQNLYQTLENKKNQLIEAKNQLEAHILTVQELSVANERNRLMAQVHDTLGHSMAEVLALLEQCEMILSDDMPDEQRSKQVIQNALKESRRSLAEIREAVSSYKKMGVEL